MKHGWGLKDAWQQSRQVLMRWVTILAAGYALGQMLAYHYSCIRRFRCERCALAWWARRQHDQAMMRAGWMRRWARRVATRRISWSDQRVRPGEAGRA